MSLGRAYVDDGLALDAPTFLQTSIGGSGQWVTNEAAALFGPAGLPFVSANDGPIGSRAR